MENKIFTKAKEIAINNLRDCYWQDGIVAGKHHFTDYWARDGFFAALGTLQIGDKEAVGRMVKLFFSFQRDDGLVPYRIMNGPVSLGKYLGRPKFYKTPKPSYQLREIGAEVLDGTILTVLFAAKLDKLKYENEIAKALEYLITRERNGLLWDGVMCEWNDSAWKWGNLLYSNVIYWKMYQELGIKSKQEEIAMNLRKILWNGKFFADWKDYKRQDYFYPFGNYLAVAWGLTTKEETEMIMKNNVVETNTPKYPWWRIDILQRMVGMADYQNGGIKWWQPITAYIVALKAVGRKIEAEKQLTKICKKIVDDKEIYECYERNGKPVKRLFYTAEHPFAWGAGMILWAMGEI